MGLGAFSISLAVKDLIKAREFYEVLGFEKFGGDTEHGYLIMNNNGVLIGLFQGMFEGNMMTFNPGWDQTAQNVDPFENVRDMHKRFKEAGLNVTELHGEQSSPASFTLTDPDGNTILIDQHR